MLQPSLHEATIRALPASSAGRFVPALVAQENDLAARLLPVIRQN